MASETRLKRPLDGRSMKIYTRTGDSGETSLFAGGRAPKHHMRVEAYGTVDELNSSLGLARAAEPSPQADQWLAKAQSQLFRLGADLATPLDAKTQWIKRLVAEEVLWLEESIDQMTAELPPLKNFILPGGRPIAAQLQVARAVCRRAERRCVELAEAEAVNEQALVYLNRMSDWLFTLARYENWLAGVEEEKWTGT